MRKVCKARARVHCNGRGQGVGRTEDLNMGKGVADAQMQREESLEVA